MSVRAIDAVWSSNIQDVYTLLVMLALADWADDDGKAYPKMESLAIKSRQSTRKARYVIDEMVERGVLRRERGGGRGNPNVYYINFEALAAIEDSTEKGAHDASNENRKDAQRAPKNGAERVQGVQGNGSERVHESTKKGARVSHTRGEPSVTVNTPPTNEDAIPERDAAGDGSERGGDSKREFLIGELVRRGVTRLNPSAPFDAERLVDNHPPNRIARQIRHFDHVLQAGGKTVTGAWLGRAIENDLALPPALTGVARSGPQPKPLSNTPREELADGRHVRELLDGVLGREPPSDE